MTALSGCAPDAIRTDKNFSIYLNKIQTACPNLRIGSYDINEWLRFSGSSDDNYNYWLDMTSRLFFGRVSEQDYRTSVGAFLGQGAANARSFDCIIGNLPAKPPVR